MIDKTTKETLIGCSTETTGPVIFNFVRWALDEAMCRGVKKLYFLARDGYTLFKIATLIIDKLNLPITCKYLYCSRNSLRLPTYHLIGEEAYDLLSLGGYHVSIASILSRVPISESTKQSILRELGIHTADTTRILSKKEVFDFTGRLRKNEIYRAAVFMESKKAYIPTIGYLRQEGLMEQDVVAIVDSGWSGSMQRSLRQLLKSAGYSGTLMGFYFGLYTQPNDPCDGIYLSWYFNSQGRIRDKALFCNNLFECILSAPHGMTLSYQECSGHFEPFLLPVPANDSMDLINIQVESILNYTLKQLPEIQGYFNREKALKMTRRAMHRFMVRPTKEEVLTYGHFLFDDDVIDSNRYSLADESQVMLLGGYSIPARFYRKFQGNNGNARELFWPYGTIAFLPMRKQRWYRWNIIGWELLKYISQYLRG